MTIANTLFIYDYLPITITIIYIYILDFSFAFFILVLSASRNSVYLADPYSGSRTPRSTICL